VVEILKNCLRLSNDSILWTPTSSGKFSTKSMHHHITSSRQVHVSPLPAFTWKCLWKLKIHHRLRLFLWKSIWNILPTKTRISASILNSTMDTSCSLCSFPTDSLFHLFFSCPIARVVWRNSFWPLDILALRISSMVLWLDIILYLEKVGIPLSDTHLFQIFATVACGQIWMAWNKAIHEDIVPNAMVISSTIKRIVKLHHSVWSNKLIPKQVVWEKPASPIFKINYDVAIHPNFSAQAAVCRDSFETIIGCSTIISPPCTLFCGEAKAAFLACQLALSLHLSQFILEGDSLTVALSLQKPTLTQDWRISPIISQIMLAIPPTTSWSVRHVNRSVNFYTHHVANCAATRFLSSCIPNFSFCSESFPPCVGRKSISSFLVP
jgi:hypothetical protein